MNILIKQGRVLDPASKTDKVMDVLIKDGFVASMEENIDESQADDVIDASGCMVMPGLVEQVQELQQEVATQLCA